MEGKEFKSALQKKAHRAMLSEKLEGLNRGPHYKESQELYRLRAEEAYGTEKGLIFKILLDFKGYLWLIIGIIKDLQQNSQ